MFSSYEYDPKLKINQTRKSNDSFDLGYYPKKGFVSLFCLMLEDMISSDKNCCIWDKKGTILLSYSKLNEYHQKYFKRHDSIRSLYRQLNYYDFKLTHLGPKISIFNENLVKGKIWKIRKKERLISNTRKRKVQDIQFDVQELVEESYQTSNIEAKYRLSNNDGRVKIEVVKQRG